MSILINSRRSIWLVLCLGLLGLQAAAIGQDTKPSPQVRLDGQQVATGPIGVGAKVPDDGVQLIGPGALHLWTRAKEPLPQENLSAEQVEALPNEAAVPVSGGSLTTRTVMGDHRLHVEWFAPPGGQGQMAGNSGVYLQNRYEIQVLGTPAGDAPPADNEAGAIYRVKAANVNASTGPGTWQSYDVWFRAPRYKNGEKTQDAHVTVYWNGRLIHDDVVLTDPTGAGEPESARPAGDLQVGPLQLQAHATDAEGPVRYRNVWVAPLNSGDEAPELGEARPLFNGENLDGWRPLGGEASYEVEDGVILGETRPNTPNTFLATTDTFSDFDLELEVKADPELNSGIQFRSTTQNGSQERNARVTGYQAEVENNAARSWAGGIYDEAGRGWLGPLFANPEARAAFKPGEWNRYRIVARGPVIQTYVNGVPAARIFDALRPEGFIALQVHGVGNRQDPLQVRWRNLRIRTPR